MTISLKTYRRAAVPLLAIQTADPAEIVRLAVSETNGNGYPVLVWDCIHGITAINETAQPVAAFLNKDMEAAIATSNPIEALRAMETIRDVNLDNKPIIVALGLGEILDDPQSKIPARQALWNLRDVFAEVGAILVMTVPMGWVNPFPDDIAVTISELPTKDQHIETANRICESAGVAKPSDSVSIGIDNTIGDALIGLSGFASEQALALSITKEGIDTDVLWERKRQQISETPGLTVYAGDEKFDDLGGLDQAKSLFGSLLKGKRKPGAVVFIDDIEKSLGGTSGDTSGVSQSMLGYLLSYMQDQNASGSIFVGPPGAAKSAMAKAIGNEGQIPTVTLDLGGSKGSLVGESEGRMRKALAVVTAISGERPFFVATCNAISVLPPELRRRFTVGTIFFDLPTRPERDTIWDIYIEKYDIKDEYGAPVDDDGWTGAEIRQCCDLADRLQISLVEARKFVVPVAISAKEKVENLRREASGRYLSASGDGIYVYAKSSVTVPKRKINLE
jgi:SpoVK/Ycf46/Vps4 family AAA+-type ATPase